jgi:hypothetical protein
VCARGINSTASNRTTKQGHSKHSSSVVLHDGRHLLGRRLGIWCQSFHSKCHGIRGRHRFWYASDPFAWDFQQAIVTCHIFAESEHVPFSQDTGHDDDCMLFRYGKCLSMPANACSSLKMPVKAMRNVLRCTSRVQNRCLAFPANTIPVHDQCCSKLLTHQLNPDYGPATSSSPYLRL